MRTTCMRAYTLRAVQLQEAVDVMVSHDWPTHVPKYGNHRQLLRCKPAFRAEVEEDRLGSPANWQLLQVRPAAHACVRTWAAQRHFHACKQARPRGSHRSRGERMCFVHTHAARCALCAPLRDATSTAATLQALRPRYWFAGHLHVHFAAAIPHAGPNVPAAAATALPPLAPDAESVTRFVAIDKPLPRRRFVQVR
jgi:lariat debranching enzyme